MEVKDLWTAQPGEPQPVQLIRWGFLAGIGFGISGGLLQAFWGFFVGVATAWFGSYGL